jgi:hypothetical protein
MGKCCYMELEYCTDILDILWPFGTFCVHLVQFSGFGIMYLEKSGNPDCLRANTNCINSCTYVQCVRHFQTCLRRDDLGKRNSCVHHFCVSLQKLCINSWGVTHRMHWRCFSCEVMLSGISEKNETVQTDDNEMLWMSDGRLRTEKNEWRIAYLDLMFVFTKCKRTST